MERYSADEMMVATALSWPLWWVSCALLEVACSRDISLADIAKLATAPWYIGWWRSVAMLGIALGMLVVSRFVAFLAQFAWYRLLRRLPIASRRMGACFYVLSFGFAVTVLLVLLVGSAAWGEVVACWALFSLLPIGTLPGLRALARYRTSGFRIRKPL